MQWKKICKDNGLNKNLFEKNFDKKIWHQVNTKKNHSDFENNWKNFFICKIWNTTDSDG